MVKRRKDYRRLQVGKIALTVLILPKEARVEAPI